LFGVLPFFLLVVLFWFSNSDYLYISYDFRSKEQCQIPKFELYYFPKIPSEILYCTFRANSTKSWPLLQTMLIFRETGVCGKPFVDILWSYITLYYVYPCYACF
jgi:hypothetical protein